MLYNVRNIVCCYWWKLIWTFATDSSNSEAPLTFDHWKDWRAASKRRGRCRDASARLWGGGRDAWFKPGAELFWRTHYLLIRHCPPTSTGVSRRTVIHATQLGCSRSGWRTTRSKSARFQDLNLTKNFWSPYMFSTPTSHAQKPMTQPKLTPVRRARWYLSPRRIGDPDVIQCGMKKKKTPRRFFSVFLYWIEWMNANIALKIYGCAPRPQPIITWVRAACLPACPPHRYIMRWLGFFLLF